MSRIPAVLCLLLCAFHLPAVAARIPAGELAVVADDGNNLRAFGGPGYQGAPILDTLGRGTPVRVLRREGGWSEVKTRGNRRGWVHSACLVPARDYLDAPGNAGEVRCPGDYPRRFTAGLGPGLPACRVDLEDVPTFDGGGGRLRVTDTLGRPVWRGPGADLFAGMDRWDPLFYFCSPVGAYWPSVVGDIDGDGMAEIVATGPQSDVSVSTFTIARWNGHAFTVVRRGMGLVETPRGSGRFAWTPVDGAFRDACWLMDVKALEPDGTAQATIYAHGPGKPVCFGLARVRFDRDGARLLGWLTPLRSS